MSVVINIPYGHNILCVAGQPDAEGEKDDIDALFEKFPGMVALQIAVDEEGDSTYTGLVVKEDQVEWKDLQDFSKKSASLSVIKKDK